ncbi:MAG TPA: hypothetical protein PLV72_00160 [Candidatus Magasanikbacteria bacterium]|nr:hypothetical protein [Candidatus Magasanikbacteria bacterium]
MNETARSTQFDGATISPRKEYNEDQGKRRKNQEDIEISGGDPNKKIFYDDSKIKKLDTVTLEIAKRPKTPQEWGDFLNKTLYPYHKESIDFSEKIAEHRDEIMTLDDFYNKIVYKTPLVGADVVIVNDMQKALKGTA